jgi:hypothetical protein
MRTTTTAALRRALPCAVGPLLLFVLFVPARSADGDKFPDGPGKAEFMKVCTQCHAVDPIATLRYSIDDWKDLVYDMKGKGADATDEECNIIIDYLAKNFGK